MFLESRTPSATIRGMLDGFITFTGNLRWTTWQTAKLFVQEQPLAKLR